ncbi:hypothetical protein ND808_34475 [Streptomyces sp. DR7-3]|uniref:hypothetical protein n=1 Tax=Streptomyces malaysiensis TaxID=92644 RepID=UPI0020443AF1|nr:hypothetical protein [Streptomyces sp. DR7-3]MCM3810893.1 hypothetical protein [Streptomyces sp. DR7-3]
MKIRWRLRMAAAQREVWTGTELRRLLAEKAGLELSPVERPVVPRQLVADVPKAAGSSRGRSMPPL